MKFVSLGLIWVVTFLLSGCSSYRLDRPEQLYLAQSYLPLPKDFKPPPDLPAPHPYIAAGNDDCTAPQGAPWRRPTGKSRTTLQVLPGMTLLVTETNYNRNAAQGVPIASRWPWKLPSAGACGDDRDWSRADLVAVRHLLSAARLPKEAATPDTDYYLQLVRAAGCGEADGTNQACSFSKVRSRLLEPFVTSLEVSYRDVGPNYEQVPAEGSASSAFPFPPDAVTTVPVIGGNLGGWLTDMTSVRPDDFFQFALPSELNLKMDVGQLCARLSSRRNAAPIYAGAAAPGNPLDVGHHYQTVSLAVCNFTLKRLSLMPRASWPLAPAPGADLVLLSSSDPLLLFRPPAYRSMLDSSGRRLCPPATPGDGTCPEDDRLSQGFVDFDMLIELHLEGVREALQVPSTMSVAQFERQHGAGKKVVELQRAAVWLPQALALRDLADARVSGTVDTSKLVSGPSLALHFMPDQSEEWRRHSGVYIVDSMKEQVILAPGDRITLAR
ncbi:hypothetical protein [Rugamonas aquatica]|uniref:Lipoprotein n=1 Tax=Rugamonas aquatica TaxID=2743357 RepID=A0A6A7N1M2_9BURK|nr:hypothetical protein [Rugamonas aquatica]MQA38933.1 hypothetical protein [Rugamonas aquatica]